MTEAERQQVIDALELAHAAANYYEDAAPFREALAIMRREREPVAWICHQQNGVNSLWWDQNQAVDRNAGHKFKPLYKD